MKGRKVFTTISIQNGAIGRCTRDFLGLVFFGFIFVFIFEFVVSGPERQGVLADETPAPSNKKSVKAFPERNLHSIDMDDDSDSTSPPKPELNSFPETKDQPASLALPNTESRRYFELTPARRMTIRRDPRKDRFVGNGVETGQSLLAIQSELQQQQHHNSFQDIQISQIRDFSGSASEPPYGKYIYVHHGPLLFEDIPVERYGQEFHPCLQPVISFTKFMGTAPMLPYKITANCYAANHYGALYAIDQQGNLRPGILEGEYFPSHRIMKQYPRANVAASIVEAGSIAGIILFIP
jgi:hypothetical protein